VHRQKGFTLLEIIIALGFLATLILPIATLLTLRDRETLAQHSHVSALQSASSLMEEISRRAFEDPNGLPQVATPNFGIDDGEVSVNRNTWDDIDDFHNLTVTINEEVVVKVEVAYWLNVDDPNMRDLTTTDNPTSFKRVLVTAKALNSPSVKLLRVFANFYNPEGL